MRAQWKIKPLGELCDILDSKRKPITKKDRTSGEFPYYGATGILDYVEDYIFDEKLVLIREDGAKWGAGENTAFAAEGKYWVNNHAHVIRPHRGIVLDEWIIYHLNANDLSPFITGLTVPKLNQAKLRDIPIPLVPLPEQKRIVAILDEAFEGIGTAVANAEKNLANARELFEATIVTNLFGEPAIQGWRLTSVENLAVIGKGSIRTGPFGSQLLHGEFVDEGVAVLGIDNAVDNEFRWAKRRFITPAKYAELSRYTVKPGDVLITIMDTCGRCAVVPDDIPLAINSKHLCCITLDRKQCLPEFLHAYFLYHPVARSFLASRAKGSIMEGLNMGIIKELPVWLPDVPTQAGILSKMEALTANVRAIQTVYEQKIYNLSELRQAVLQKAFAGQLTAQPKQFLQEAVA